MRIHFISLGCDKNLVDSEIMLGIISAAGHTITDDDGLADVIVVNTCGFISDAVDESIETILRMSKKKTDGVCSALIVTGCMAQRYKDEIMKEIPEVDAVVGVGDFEEIARVIGEAAEGGKVSLITGKTGLPDDANILNRMVSTPPYMAYLKIAEGCDNCCTYCTIPSIRGRYVSRRPESLLAEARALAGKGVKEIVLVAQDTARYGVDLFGKSVLHELLAGLSDIDGIEWIRLMYCYPEHITDDTIAEMRQNHKICHYLDMPVQHSEDSVLRRMGRESNNAKLRQVIAGLREAMPDIVLRTTLIVGFPGETEHEFEGLLDFMREMRFDRLGVFEYSREPGTPAASLPGQVSSRVKKKRKNMAMKLQKDISAEKCKQHIGGVLKVIVDGKLPEDGVYCGRSRADAYEVDGMVFFKSERELMSGDFVDVLVTDASDYDVMGEIMNTGSDTIESAE